MTPKRRLPAAATAYRRTPRFTAETTPPALLRIHRLAAGVYGRLEVEQGEVRFYAEGATAPLAALQAGDSLIILPQEPHFIEISEDVCFQVTFHR